VAPSADWLPAFLAFWRWPVVDDPGELVAHRPLLERFGDRTGIIRLFGGRRWSASQRGKCDQCSQSGGVRSPTTSFQAVNRVFISCRCWAAMSRWRRGRKCGDIPLNAERNRCALPGERNLFIGRSAAWSAGGRSRLGCSDSTVSGLSTGIRSGSRTRTSWTSLRRHRHLTFANGPRFFLGSPLARLEGQIAIGTLMRRLSGLRLDTDAVQWLPNSRPRGLVSLPVTY
jgi:hypothetical protein